MGRSSIPAWGPLLLACEAPPDPLDVALPEPPPVASVAPGPSTVPSAAAVPARVPACAVREHLVLGEGFDDLRNVRVLAEAGGAVVTFESRSQPDMGDSSQSAHVARIDWARSGPERAREVTLPYRAYASAMYSYIGPTRHAGSSAFFAYGLAGQAAFELHGGALEAWSDVDPHSGEPLASARQIAVSVAFDEGYAVAPDRPVAVVGGREAPCPAYHLCDELAEAWQQPLVDSVRVVSLTQPPTSRLLWKGRLKKPAPLVPAIAFGRSRGAAAYRASGDLFVSMLDAALSPSPPVRIASGDVGAPAIVWSRDQPIVVWAERSMADEPYRLLLWDGEAKHVLRSDRHVSSFAPGLAVHGESLLVTWMEGDAKTRGTVRLARTPLAELGAPLDPSSITTLSPHDGNARDPEVSASGDEVVVVWSQHAPGGPSRVEARRLSCAR